MAKLEIDALYNTAQEANKLLQRHLDRQRKEIEKEAMENNLEKERLARDVSFKLTDKSRINLQSIRYRFTDQISEICSGNA